MSAPNVQRRLEQDGRVTVHAHTSSKTLTNSELNQVHTNRGATGAITLTLPAASGAKGRHVDVFVVEDQNVTITSESANDLVTHNNKTATSISFQTAGDKIGSGVRLLSDGSSWLVLPMFNDNVTMTIA